MVPIFHDFFLYSFNITKTYEKNSLDWLTLIRVAGGVYDSRNFEQPWNENEKLLNYWISQKTSLEYIL